MGANDRQVGGNHYKRETGIPQHWDVVIALNWDYLTGAATKYLWRLGRKGDEAKAVEDITKAIHYLEKKRELMIDAIQNRPVNWSVSVGSMLHDGGDPDSNYTNQDR